MRRFFSFWPALTLLTIWAIFFYKFLFFGLLPFPGDLLIAEYKPWSIGSFLGYIPGTYPNKAQYFDVIREHYPWRELVMHEWKQANIPLWNPYNFSGHPLLANHQSAALYPGNILFFALPTPLAWSILVSLQPLLASIFAYMYLRSIAVKKLPAIFATTAFSYSLAMSTYLHFNTLGHTMMFLPLLLFAVEKYFKAPVFSSLIITLGIAYAAFAGHFQIFGLTLAVFLLYAIVRLKVASLHTKITLALSAAFGLGISTAQLFPTLELINLSARSNHELQDMISGLLIQPVQLLMYLSQDVFGNPATRNYLLGDAYPSKAMYIGVTTIMLAVASILTQSKRARYRIIVFFTGALLLTTIRNPLTDLLAKLQIPFFASSNPGNSLFLLSFFGAVLAAWALQSLNKITRTTAMTLVLALLVLICILIAAKLNAIAINASAVYYAVALLIVFFTFAFILKKRPGILPIIQWLIICITVADLFYHFHKFNPFVPAQLVFPDTTMTSYLKNLPSYDRAWGYGTARIEANFATHIGYFSPDGTDPLYPKWYGQLVHAARNGKIPERFDKTTRSDAHIPPGYGKDDLIGNQDRLALMNILSVRYFIDRAENNLDPESILPDRFEHRESLGDWRVYENTQAWPRVYTTSNIVVTDNPDTITETLFNKHNSDNKRIVLDRNPDPLPEEKHGDVRAQISRYSPIEVSVNLRTAGNTILVLTDTYFPGWTAVTGDNTKLPVLRANLAQRAVAITPEITDITFRYYPLSWNLGALIAGTSILGSVIWLITLRLAIRKTKESQFGKSATLL